MRIYPHVFQWHGESVAPTRTGVIFVGSNLFERFWQKPVLSQAERGFLADMKVFTQTQEIPEGRKVAGQRPGADATA